MDKELFFTDLLGALQLDSSHPETHAALAHWVDRTLDALPRKTGEEAHADFAVQAAQELDEADFPGLDRALVAQRLFTALRRKAGKGQPGHDRAEVGVARTAVQAAYDRLAV